MARISDSLKQELLALKKSELTVTMITKLFGHTVDTKSDKPFDVKPPKFNTTDTMRLDANEYINKESVDTSVGIFLWNKLLVEEDLESIVPNGYYNEVLTKKKLGKFLDLVAKEVKDKNLPIDPNLSNFLRNFEFWGLKLSFLFGASFTKGLLVPGKELEKAKKELLKDTEGKSINELVNIEDKLVDIARKVTEGDPGRALFDSGARGSFENDYKNMMVAVGPTMNPITGQYDYVKSSYLGGIGKEDVAAAGNIIVNAEYPKAIGTARGGYLTKQFYAVFQSVVFDEEGSDCHSKEGLIVKITEDNIKDYIDQYAFGKNGLVLIDEKNAKDWIGRSIKIRSPMFCKGDRICSKCAGMRYYKVGVDSVGLTTINISSKILNAGMKHRHSSKIDLNQANINKLVRYKKKTV